MHRAAFSVLCAALLLSSAGHGGTLPRPRIDGFALLGTTAQTRALVIAPHPDDETLGAGGLIQRIHEIGGQVRVVFLTDGDAYPEGVRRERHRRSLQPGDFRGYGALRERESRSALMTLGLSRDAATFLSFPDQGLRRLMTGYWSERRAAFRSPYTRRDRPPKGDVIVPDTEYRGEDLTQELAQIIGEYQPSLIIVTRQEDQHPDHCAAWYFAMDALGDVQRVDRSYTPSVLTYVVHWYSWPFEDDAARIDPPRGLRSGTTGWLDVPLSDAERRTKRIALHQYRTQVHTMAWFLDGFARSNEIFARPAPARVVLPLRRNPCED